MHKVSIGISIILAFGLIGGAYMLRADEGGSLYKDISDVAVPSITELPPEYWVQEADTTHELVLFPDAVFREYKDGVQIRYGVWESELLFYEDDSLGTIVLTSAVMQDGVRPVQKLHIVDATDTTLSLKDAETQKIATYHLRTP